MHNELSKTMEIIVDLIIIANLIIFIAIIGDVSMSLRKERLENLAIRQELLEYRELYPYNNKIVNGNDIVIIMSKYAKRYTVEVDTNVDPNIVSYAVFNPSDPSSLWSIEYIKYFLINNNLMNQKFKVELIKIIDDGELEKSMNIKSIRFKTI